MRFKDESMKMIRWPAVAVFYLAVLFLIREPVHGNYIFMGIPAAAVRGEVDYLAFSRWLLMMSAPILASGFFLERSSRIELFARLRMKDRKQWNIRQLSAGVAIATTWALSLGLLSVFCVGMETAVQVFLLLWLSFVLENFLLMSVFLLSGKAAWSGVISILLTGGLFLFGEHVHGVGRYLPTMWGMFCRSAHDQPDGYSFWLSIILLVLANLLSAFVYGCTAGRRV